MIRHLRLVLLVAVLCGGGPKILLAGDEPTGIEAMWHAGLSVSELQPALHFYIDQLGLKEAFRLNRPDGTPMLVYMRVGDSKSFIEVFPGQKPKGGAPLPGNYHLGLIVKDLQATLRALQARGYPVPPEAFKQATRLLPDNTYNCFIMDPDGNKIELSQTTPESVEFKFGTVLTLPAGSLKPESPAPAAQPEANSGGVPPSLRAKMARLRALADKREAEGFDMTTAGPVADGIRPLLEQHKYTEAEALVDRVLKLLGDSPTPESPAPAAQPEANSGGVPPSLQAKMARLMALAHKREDEGFDMAPVAEVADGVQPLIDQKKYTEAEAQVDRALKLLGESTPEGQASSPDAKHP